MPSKSKPFKVWKRIFICTAAGELLPFSNRAYRRLAGRHPEGALPSYAGRVVKVAFVHVIYGQFGNSRVGFGERIWVECRKMAIADDGYIDREQQVAYLQRSNVVRPLMLLPGPTRPVIVRTGARTCSNGSDQSRFSWPITAQQMASLRSLLQNSRLAA